MISLIKSKFINYVSNYFFNDNWSLDACYGRAITEGKFTREEMVCVKTLYDYVDSGLIGIKNHHLRKLLGYKTSDELFEEELDKIYQVDAA